MPTATRAVHGFHREARNRFITIFRYNPPDHAPPVRF
jgi:hypothetical protein